MTTPKSAIASTGNSLGLAMGQLRGQIRPFGQGLQTRWPGALLCVAIALAAATVAGVHNGPQLLYALLFGIALHALDQRQTFKPGVAFCTSVVLRLGVALLGARITGVQIAALGWPTALIVVGSVVSTILFGLWFGRRLGLSLTEGLLSGGATAICGASAALAIAAVLPRTRDQERFTLLVVIAVTTMSTVAMVIYPFVAQAFHLPPALAGLFLGGSIHDVAQVVGAGYSLGQETGDAATIVKLLRISMLAAVVIVVSAAYRNGHSGADAEAAPSRPALVPWFLWAFLVLVCLNSAHAIPTSAQPLINEASRACLVVAIAGLGVRTSFRMLLSTGWRPFMLLFMETLWLAGIVLTSTLMIR